MLLAFLLTLVAGLATSLGGILATHKKILERSVFAVMLAFAAGAMLFVSFVEILPHALGAEGGHSHEGSAIKWLVFASFFVGISLVALLDKLIPRPVNPNEIEGDEHQVSEADRRVQAKLLRSGVLLVVVLALHNFPEGMSTFLAAYENVTIGIALAIAIAIHNIPEGIAVAAPIYIATKSRKKAVMWATISGLTEPLGALLAAGLVSIIIPAEFMSIVFGVVAGMMVFIALDELLPAARRYQTRQHQVVYGMVAGMAVVALGLALF